MRKISDAIVDIVQSNQFLQFGLHHRLLNLTQVSRFLKPLIEARAQKGIQLGAVSMALSRLQRTFQGEKKQSEKRFALDNLSIQTGLNIITVEKDRESLRLVGFLHEKVKKQGGYFTITEGLSEITVILDNESLPLAAEFAQKRVVFSSSEVAALSVKFSERYLKTPGFLFAIFQSLAFQRINVIEVASTTTELIVYLQHDDLELAFETLLHQFRRR